MVLQLLACCGSWLVGNASLIGTCLSGGISLLRCCGSPVSATATAVGAPFAMIGSSGMRCCGNDEEAGSKKKKKNDDDGHSRSSSESETPGRLGRRMTNVTFVAVMAVLALIIRAFPPTVNVDGIWAMRQCTQETCRVDVLCLRLLMSLATYHVASALLARRGEGFSWRLVVFGGAVIGSLFLPDRFVAATGWASHVVTAGYLASDLSWATIMLAEAVNEHLAETYAQDDDGLVTALALTVAPAAPFVGAATAILVAAPGGRDLRVTVLLGGIGALSLILGILTFPPGVRRHYAEGGLAHPVFVAAHATSIALCAVDAQRRENDDVLAWLVTIVTLADVLTITALLSYDADRREDDNWAAFNSDGHSMEEAEANSGDAKHHLRLACAACCCASITVRWRTPDFLPGDRLATVYTPGMFYALGTASMCPLLLYGARLILPVLCPSRADDDGDFPMFS